MTVEEIYAKQEEISHLAEKGGSFTAGTFRLEAGKVFFLAEIAAQLSIQNEHLARLEYLADSVINCHHSVLQVKVSHE